MDRQQGRNAGPSCELSARGEEQSNRDWIRDRDNQAGSECKKLDYLINDLHSSLAEVERSKGRYPWGTRAVSMARFNSL